MAPLVFILLWSLSCPLFSYLFYALSLAVSLFQIYAKKILKAFLRYYCITSGSCFPWILRFSLSPVAGPARVWAPSAHTRPGGSSPPCLLCSYPRSGRVTFAWTGLGGLSRPEQIPEVCNLRTIRIICLQSIENKNYLFFLSLHSLVILVERIAV